MHLCVSASLDLKLGWSQQCHVIKIFSDYCFKIWNEINFLRIDNEANCTSKYYCHPLFWVSVKTELHLSQHWYFAVLR